MGLYPGANVTQVKIDQGAAGSTDIAVAPTDGNARIFVLKICVGMAAAGTLKFTEGTGPTDITGALPLAANAGFVMEGTLEEPVLWTPTVNSKLSIVTTVGAAKGWLVYFTSVSTP